MTRSPFGLTAKQRELLDVITARLEAGKPAPSYDELRDALGLASKGSIARLVEALIERRHLVRLPNRARALALPNSAAERELEEIATRTEQARLSAQGVGLPTALTMQLLAHCKRYRRMPSDVIAEALAAHFRGLS